MLSGIEQTAAKIAAMGEEVNPWIKRYDTKGIRPYTTQNMMMDCMANRVPGLDPLC
jgi:hypothetical protein